MELVGFEDNEINELVQLKLEFHFRNVCRIVWKMVVIEILWWCDDFGTYFTIFKNETSPLKLRIKLSFECFEENFSKKPFYTKILSSKIRGLKNRTPFLQVRLQIVPGSEKKPNFRNSSLKFGFSMLSAMFMQFVTKTIHFSLV